MKTTEEKMNDIEKELRRSLTEAINTLDPMDCETESLKTPCDFFRNLDKSIMQREYLQKVSESE